MIGLIAEGAGVVAAAVSALASGVSGVLAGGCIGFIVIGLMPMGRCVFGGVLSSAILILRSSTVDGDAKIKQT